MSPIGRPQLFASAFALLLLIGAMTLAVLADTGGTGVLIAIMLAGALGGLLVVHTLIER